MCTDCVSYKAEGFLVNVIHVILTHSCRCSFLLRTVLIYVCASVYVCACMCGCGCQCMHTFLTCCDVIFIVGYSAIKLKEAVLKVKGDMVFHVQNVSLP